MRKLGNSPSSTPSEEPTFVKIFQPIADRYGLVAAAIYGSVYAYCQIRADGVCFASHEKIGQRINVGARTVRNHISIIDKKTPPMIRDGFISEEAHQKSGGTNVYTVDDYALLSIFMGKLQDPRTPARDSDQVGKRFLPLGDRSARDSYQVGKRFLQIEEVREEKRLIEELKDDDDDDNSSSSSSANPTLKFVIARITSLSDSNKKVLEAAAYLEGGDNVTVAMVLEWFEKRWPGDRVSNPDRAAPWPSQVQDGVEAYKAELLTPRGSRPG